jgi:vancomycin permeability regulator SanA
MANVDVMKRIIRCRCVLIIKLYRFQLVKFDNVHFEVRYFIFVATHQTDTKPKNNNQIIVGESKYVFGARKNHQSVT